MFSSSFEINSYSSTDKSEAVGGSDSISDTAELHTHVLNYYYI